MFFLNALAGLIFRRNWGGWCVPPHIIKVILGFALSFAVGYLLIPNLYAAVAFGVIIGLAFLNPFHSWGMGMGYDGSGKSTLACVAVMGGSYGAFTSVAAAIGFYFMRDPHYLTYALNGFLTPIPYLIGWKWAAARSPASMQLFKVFDQWFIDSPTAIGECGLGFLLWLYWHV